MSLASASALTALGAMAFRRPRKSWRVWGVCVSRYVLYFGCCSGKRSLRSSVFGSLLMRGFGHTGAEKGIECWRARIMEVR